MTVNQPYNQSSNPASKSASHSVIILAAGLSRRLGQPKQLLTQQGQTLLSKTIDMALHSNPVAVVVVIPKLLNNVLQAVQLACQKFTNLYFVQNNTPKTGLADSLNLGISKLAALQKDDCHHLRPEKVLIMGVDQILLDGQHLAYLLAGIQPIVASAYSIAHPIASEATQYQGDMIQSTETANSDAAAVKLITGLPLVIDFKLLQSWQANLTGDKGLRHLIRALPSEQISRVRNDKLSFDIDTPAQLVYARAQGWIDSDVTI